MTETIRFPVAGMTCSTCVNRITRALKRLEGVDRIHVDLGTELVTLRRASGVGDTAIAAALGEAGYEANLEAAVAATDAHSSLARLLGR